MGVQVFRCSGEGLRKIPKLVFWPPKIPEFGGGGESQILPYVFSVLGKGSFFFQRRLGVVAKFSPITQHPTLNKERASTVNYIINYYYSFNVLVVS